jgi:hypothetical protein
MSFLGDKTMKKFLALTVVFAALAVLGCAEKKTVPPPANTDAPAATETAPVDGTTTEAPATTTP